MNKSLRGDERWKPLVALSAIDDRFRVIFDAVYDGIFLTDPSTGRFIEVNAAGCALFGYAKAELIGKDIALLSSGIPPYTLEAAIELSENAQPEEAKTFEWQCKTKANVMFWAEVSIRYTRIGHLPVNISTLRDITERKRLNWELMRATGKAAAANDSKSAFLANMSHELRTPLNAVIGFSDLMLGRTGDALGVEKCREYIEDIRTSGVHLLALINDILDFSRLDAGMMVLDEQDVALDRVIGNVCHMVEDQASRCGIDILIDIPAGLPHVVGDERRIRQIALNLLSNALKFSRGPGSVAVRAWNSPDGVRFSVRDTGIGIAKADLPKILERFAQIDCKFSRRYEGAGLGLPLVKQLVELHGGEVMIESEEGTGTCVTVSFPPERSSIVELAT